MTKYSPTIDTRLDVLATEARERLARIPGQPTAAETVAEMYRGMVRAVGAGFHPDTEPEEYVSLPEGYDGEVLAAIEAEADEHDLDVYDLAIEALTKPDLVDREFRGGFRVYTRQHCSFDRFPARNDGGPSLVTVDGWGVSYSTDVSHLYGGERTDTQVKLSIAKNHGDEEGFEFHALNGTKYDTTRDAQRAAFDAGALGFMVYEDDAHLFEDDGSYTVDPMDDIPAGTPDSWIPDNPNEDGFRQSDFI